MLLLILMSATGELVVSGVKYIDSDGGGGDLSKARTYLPPEKSMPPQRNSTDHFGGNNVGSSSTPRCAKRPSSGEH